MFNRKTSSQRIWGDNVPTEDEKQEALNNIKENYPDCYSAAEQSLDCATKHHLCQTNPCTEINNRLKFCFVFTHCPKEAEEFANCVRGYGKKVWMDSHPAGCRRAFSKLDNCMTSQTQ